VTSALRIPTIGIGAGAGCDGQVLVLHDMLGLNPGFRPRFARSFADGAALVRGGAARFAEAVRLGEFPAEEEGF
jgi:3-methyl-2-oxobutanoate hydroxymethyltransferase